MKKDERQLWRLVADQSTQASVAAGILVLCTPMLVGGRPGWSVFPITAMAVFALMVVGRASTSSLRLLEADVLVLALIAITGAGLIATPWSSSLVTEGRALAGLNTWAPWTYSPGATKEQVVVGVIIAASYLTGRLYAANHGRAAGVLLVAMSSFAMAVVAFGHEFVNAEKVFGLYSPPLGPPRLLAPLLNANQLGGFTAFGAALWIGIAADSAQHRRGLAIVAAILCSMAAMGAGSRGAVLSLALGTVWGLWVVLHNMRARPRRVLLTFGVAALVTTALVLWQLEPLSREFGTADYSKLELFAATLKLIGEHPLLGVGRGAFESAFAVIGPGDVRFTHPENFLLQWATEWGVPVTILVCGVLARHLYPAFRSSRPRVAIAAGALAAFGIHELFDFAMERPGVVVPIAFLVGTLARATSRNSIKKVALRPYSKIGFPVMCGLATVGLFLGWGVDERRVDYHRGILLSADVLDLPELIHDAVEDHPADPRISLVIGAALVREQEAGALRWLNRTMTLAPSWSSPHTLAAWALASRGAYGQAALEAREAMLLGGSADVLCELVGYRTAPQLGSLVLPLGMRQGEAVVTALARCLEVAKLARLDDFLIENGVILPSVLVRRGRRSVEAGELDAAIDDFQEAGELGAVNADLFLARAIFRRDGPDYALESLGGIEGWAAQELRVEMASFLGDAELDEEFQRLQAEAAGDPSRLAIAWSRVGQAYRRQGRVDEAIRAYVHAYRLDNATGHLWVIVRIADQNGRRARARTTRIELCLLGEERACRD